MELECRISVEKESLLITLLMAQLERAYMLIDALRDGFLNGFILHGNGKNVVCQYHAAGDILHDGIGLMLSENSVGCIKRMLLDVTLRPADAAWLHVDIEADGGAVTVRTVNE